MPDHSDLEYEYLESRKAYLPWERNVIQSEAEQVAIKDLLRKHAGAKHFGSNSFVSPKALIFTDSFELHDNSWIAGGAVIRGSVTIGSNSSINPYAHIAGWVRIGDGVRVAGQVSIYGFNHGFERIDIPMYQQRHTSRGITIGDGVWIGANAVIVDGISIGQHSIVAGGAIVTKDVAPFSVVGGNPAKIIRSRLAQLP